MTVDAIIMAILNYGFYIGGFCLGLYKTINSDKQSKKAS